MSRIKLHHVAILTISLFVTVQLFILGFQPTAVLQAFQISLPSRTQNIAQAPAPTAIPRVADLYFDPKELTATQAGGIKTATLYLAPNGQQVKTIDVHMAFNPNQVSNVQVTLPQESAATASMTNNIVDIIHGSVNYTVVLDSKAVMNPTLSQKIAVVSFQLKNPNGDTIFSFLPATGVYTNDQSQAAAAQSARPASVLRSATPLTLMH